MIVPAIGGVVIIVIVNREAAVFIVMMVGVDADLRRTVRRIMHCPGRNRDAHTKRQTDNGKLAQKMVDGVHRKLGRRSRNNGQS